MGPEAKPCDALVEVFRSPVRKARIDGLLERHDPLGDAARRRDHDDHHDARLEKEHLGVPNRRRLEGRRRDEREQARHIREHLRRRLERRLDLDAHHRQVERKARRARLETLEQDVDVRSVSALGRDAAGRRVRVGQEPERFQLRELRSDGRRRDGQLRARDEVLRADGLAGRHVLLDDPLEDHALTRCELRLHPVCRHFIRRRLRP
jgi:hypothetical protein